MKLCGTVIGRWHIHSAFVLLWQSGPRAGPGGFMHALMDISICIIIIIIVVVIGREGSCLKPGVRTALGEVVLK